MNRAQRRKVISKLSNDAIKGREQVKKVREQALKKKQYGFGLVITNLMVVVIFWRWTWKLVDRRV